MIVNLKLFDKIFISLITILLYSIRYYNDINLLYLILIVLGALVFKPHYILSVFFISSFSGDFFDIGDGYGSVNRFIILVLLVSLAINFTKQKKTNKKEFNLSSLIFVLIFYCSLSFFYATSFIVIVKFFQIFLLLILIKSIKTDYRYIFALIHWCSLILFSLIVIEFYYNGINFIDLETRLSINTNVNENRFAMMLVHLGIILVFPFFLKNTSKVNKLLSAGLYFFILFLIFLTGSRTSLISCLIPILVLIFYVQKKYSSKIFLFVALITLSFYVMSFIDDFFVFKRYSNNAAASSGINERLKSINLIVNTLIPNNLFFGVGLGGENVTEAMKPFSQTQKPAHNLIIDCLAQIGVLGFSLFFLLIFKIVKKVISSIKSHHFLIFLPILLFFSNILAGIGETVFLERYFWNTIAFLYLIINQHQVKTSKPYKFINE